MLSHGGSGQSGVKAGDVFGNEMVFEGKQWNANQCFELVKIIFATWANAKWPKEFPSIFDTYRQPPTKCEQQKWSKAKKECRNRRCQPCQDTSSKGSTCGVRNIKVEGLKG
ncbi:Uncharacterized protein TCM_029028 [Theobroma cacao]|uniref:Uncharacterized protein n=1 Tax=Theobroma cacao TaxID=3641 RepID=A0A061GJ48_THECC|nr:Uncharacterized protein TCM_029028 [Theobroma cacao]